MSRPELAGLRLAAPPERWAALGFAPAGAELWVGGIRLELGVPGHGIAGWTLRDGPAGTTPPEVSHPNGVVAVDHVVLLTGDFDATSARLEGDGMAFRRVREVPPQGDRPSFRQGFRRLGPAILEVVEAPGQDAESFWGITFIAADLDVLSARLGELLGPPRAAIQPGRRIAALHSERAGIGCAVAFMTPEGRGLR